MTAVQTAGAASLTAAGQRESAASQYRVGRVCFLKTTASSFFLGRNRVLEPDEGKLSRPVLRGLEASNGLRLLGNTGN